jgi:sugar (pentulose or hexulose) kinase
MPSQIRRFCEATGQEAPEEPGQVARCILESLALKYRWVVEQAGEITGQNVEVVHIVGGGSQNALLCQLTADAMRLPVLSGPVEATALGNIAVQAFARGYVNSLEEIRTTIRRSVEVHTYEPDSSAEDDWNELRERFSRVMEAATELASLEGE